MKNPALIVFLALLLNGCTTVTEYDAKGEARPARSADYPIYVYAEDKRVPRAFEIIGSMHVGDTPFTVKGGSLGNVLKTLQQHARQKGADGLQITEVESPGFTSANYRVDANFIRFTDVWESVPLAEDEFVAYLRTNKQTIDPIEGVWSGNDPAQSRIGVIKNSSKGGRDFIAFILSTRSPSWQPGDKKLDIARGERSGVYRGDYYLDDYEGKKAVILLDAVAGRFAVRTSDDSVILFSRKTAD